MNYSYSYNPECHNHKYLHPWTQSYVLCWCAKTGYWIWCFWKPPCVQGAMPVVKTIAMTTTWIGGKSVAMTTGRLINGPRTSNGTPNHQESRRKRNTRKRAQATKWSWRLALQRGTLGTVAMDVCLHAFGVRIFFDFFYVLPVVPHKAVAEVSE